MLIEKHQLKMREKMERVISLNDIQMEMVNGHQSARLGLTAHKSVQACKLQDLL